MTVMMLKAKQDFLTAHNVMDFYNPNEFKSIIEFKREVKEYFADAFYYELIEINNEMFIKYN